MNSVLIVGLILSTGFLLGEIVTWIKLPKVSGYILAGIVLNPTLTHFIPKNFVENTGLAIDIALSIIAFSVGGALSYSRLKKLGKSVLLITALEAQTALIVTASGFILFLWLLPSFGYQGLLKTIIPLSLLLGSLACPTDPSATLAITHEYHAKGKVSSTILSVAGLDDVLGLFNFTFATAVAIAMVRHTPGMFQTSIVHVVYSLGGAMLVGSVSALMMMLENRIFQKEKEGAHIVITLSLLATCFGISTVLGFDALLACMVMGAFIVNFSRVSRSVFRLLERYTDELVFVLFFTLSAMQLDFSVLKGVALLIVMFVLLRFAGKITGTLIGGRLSDFTFRDSLHTGIGFIPQGGIVIGLALMSGNNQAFEPFGNTLVAIVIGSTIIHELVGPVLSMVGIRSAGELGR
jgi:NhaP-type Na+/H+ or K+/H+ antiporter